MIKLAIVEDLPIILEGTKVLINQIPDFNVIGEYLNGEDLLKGLKKERPDVILTDIDMPVMDGISATRAATSLYPDLKIIALSMHQDKKYYYEMITAGAKGFVLKQSSVEELESAIREVYHGGSYFSKELLHGIIMGMQSLESEIIREKKELLKLSEREIKMLHFICEGLSNKELADRLYVSIRTIESAKTRMMQKTHSKNTAGLIIWAIKNHIVQI
ncbi:MAG: response regulator transcription factor [Bacteroidales bacterium]|nr:response regulator transcription factor [Bacteroidales bacterium]